MHSSPSHACYMSYLSYSPSFHHSNYTGRRVQVMKLLIMQFSLTSRQFISFRSKYSRQDPDLKHPHSLFLPLGQRSSYASKQNHRQDYSFVYSNIFVFRQQTRRQKVMDWMIINITRIQFPMSTLHDAFPLQKIRFLSSLSRITFAHPLRGSDCFSTMKIRRPV
jgi:hypothetical protein